MAKKWKKSELDYLKRVYRTSITFNEIMENLPGRSEDSIRLKASRIGLSRPFNNDPTVFNRVRCWGVDFDQTCVDRCPDWVNCLDQYAEEQKSHIIIGENRATVNGAITGGMIAEALRGIKKID